MGAGGTGSVVEVEVEMDDGDGATVVDASRAAEVTVVSDDEADCASVVAARAGRATAAVATAAPTAMSPATRRMRAVVGRWTVRHRTTSMTWRSPSWCRGTGRWDEAESLGGFVTQPQTHRNRFDVELRFAGAPGSWITKDPTPAGWTTGLDDTGVIWGICGHRARRHRRLSVVATATVRVRDRSGA